MNQQTKANLVARKIKTQFNSSAEGILMYSVVERTIKDLTKKISPKDKVGLIDKQSAARYLSGHMPHCELAWVDSEWDHRLMAKIGLNLAL